MPAALYIIHEGSPPTAADATGALAAALALGAASAFTSSGLSSTGCGAAAAEPALLLSAGAGDFDWRPVDFLAEGAGDAAGDLAGVDDADFLAEGAGDAALRGGMLFNAMHPLRRLCRRGCGDSGRAIGG